MIEIKALHKNYGKKSVLENVNLVIPDSSVFGMVGINGAGKSTLLRLMAGVLKPEAGEITVDGVPVYENECAKRKIFFLPDEPYYNANITAEGLADLYRAFYDFDEDTYKKYLDEFKLSPKGTIHNYSKGMKRQVFVALALAIAPKYLLLDEAFDGLDPLARLVFRRGIVNLIQEKGSTVVISSHSLRELEDICDSYVLIDRKTASCSGEIVRDLEKFHKYQAAFFGEVTKENLGVSCMRYSRSGRVVNFVTDSAYAEVEKALSPLAPLFLEELPMDFEELFACEVENRGYLK